MTLFYHQFIKKRLIKIKHYKKNVFDYYLLLQLHYKNQKVETTNNNFYFIIQVYLYII